MEKLEPVLKQKFWILLGVAILMTLIGWWMATGKMVQAITDRQKAIEQSFSSVPKGEIPNESWSKRLSIINDSQDQSIKLTKLELWKRQEAKMTWPQGVIPVNGYWGKFQNDSRELYRSSWSGEIERVWRLLNPMDEDGNGIVYFPFPNMGRTLKKSKEPWRQAPPDSDVMWETREDLWLLEGLFQSISSINGGPTATRSDACIHQIDKLELRGGGQKTSQGGATAGVDSGVGGGMAAMMMMNPGMGNLSGGGAGRDGVGALSAGLTTVSAEFDPAEEFGDDGSGGSGTGAVGTSAMMMPSMGDVSATTTAAKPANRYLQIEEKLPYKQRGFYLSMKMDHRKIPLLIAELTSNEKSVWPVEIVRVQMSRLNEDGNEPAGPSGGSGAGGMGASMASMMSRMAQGGSGATGSSAAGMLAGDDEFGASFATPGGSVPGEIGTSEKALNAKSFLDNALRDPIIAQVTICGTFTLYKKVEEVVVPQTPSSAEATPDATAAAEQTPDGAQAKGDGQEAKPGDETQEEVMEAETESKPAAESNEEFPDSPPTTPPGEKPDTGTESGKTEIDKNDTGQK